MHLYFVLNNLQNGSFLVVAIVIVKNTLCAYLML